MSNKTTQTISQLGKSSTTTLSELQYNQLGQVKTKKLGSVDQTDYTYTIRGWLKTMNSLKPTGKAHLGISLYYNDAMDKMTNTKQWNGNISAMQWATANASTTASASETFAYTYSYDGNNRLIKADFGRSAKWDTIAYDEPLICYDANGNITTYQRNDQCGKHLNYMSYSYNGNQLINIDNKGYDGPVKSSMPYAYDPNGNLIRNDSKDIHEIEYNYLNLPVEIEVGANSVNILRYVYDAAGNKLSKHTTATNANTDSIQYYAGNMVYNAAKKLLYVLTDEGRAVNNNGAFNYEYFIKDHLGNVRMVIQDNAGIAKIVQETHYYPFGLAMKGLGTDITSPKNNYLYNGNELQTDFNINLEDYGARLYDATIGRWWCIDPEAEKYYSISPYVYCHNNPINRVDYGGLGDGDDEDGGDSTVPIHIPTWDEMMQGQQQVENYPVSNILLYNSDIEHPGWYSPDYSNMWSSDAAYTDMTGMGPNNPFGSGMSSMSSKEFSWNIEDLMPKYETPSIESQFNSMLYGFEKFMDGTTFSNLVNSVADGHFEPLAQLMFGGGPGSNLAGVGAMGVVGEGIEGANIALGIKEDLTRFAETKGFSTYRNFSKGFQQDKIEAAIKNSSNQLHFNLTEFSSFRYFRFNPKDFVTDGNITNWELHTIYNTPGALERTTFYRFKNGKYEIVPKPF